MRQKRFPHKIGEQRSEALFNVMPQVTVDVRETAGFDTFYFAHVDNLTVESPSKLWCSLKAYLPHNPHHNQHSLHVVKRPLGA